MLEVWRTLWMELDHMDAPGASDGPFNGDPGCMGCDDVSATPADPAYETLYNLLEPLNVLVLDLSMDYDTHHTIPFVHNQPNSATPQVRDVNSSRHFWTIHMLGAYEWEFDKDNDPNTEAWVVGWSENAVGVDPTNFVFFEAARDLHAEPEWPNMVALNTLLDRISAHEALHRFFGWHNPNVPTTNEGIMDPETAATAATVSLSSSQVKIIQTKPYPK
jgi:hypothetical protein